jgi:hypothetical protein
MAPVSVMGAGAARIDEGVGRGGVDQDRLGESRSSSDVSERTGSRGGVADGERSGGIDAAQMIDHKRARVDGRGSGVGRGIGGRGKGQGAGAVLLEEVRLGIRGEDIAQDQGIGVATDGERADAGGLVGIPEAGPADGHQAVAVVIEVGAGIILRGSRGRSDADHAGETVEHDAEAVAGGEVDVRRVRTRSARDGAEGDDTADEGASKGAIDDEGAGGVVTDMDIGAREAVEGVGTDFERAVVEVDGLEAGVLAEGRAGSRDTDGAAVDAGPAR